MSVYDSGKTSAALTLVFAAAALVLLVSTVIIIQVLSIEYGIGAGAQVQSVADSSNVTALFKFPVQNLQGIYNSIIVEYASFITSLALLFYAALLFRRGFARSLTEANSHAALQVALVIVYIALFIVNSQVVSLVAPGYLIDAIYSSVFICAAIGFYSISMKYVVPSKAGNDGIPIDPSKPYTNLLKIKYEIFARLYGSIGIVDKHMNSVGMENLHRLLQGNLGNITDITILTSRSMLDSEFWRNYLDCKAEIELSGTKMAVMVMKDEDAVEQHERFVFDEASAYKVPPFNVIHKKSEHITGIDVADAKRRFSELYKRATKYENFQAGPKRHGG